MSSRLQHLRVTKRALDYRERALKGAESALERKELLQIRDAKAFVYWEIAAEHDTRRPIRDYSRNHQTTYEVDTRLARQIAHHIQDNEAVIVAETHQPEPKRPRTSKLTDEQLAEPGTPPSHSLVFVGTRRGRFRCSLCGREERLGFVFAGPSSLLVTPRTDLLQVKQEGGTCLCSWCAVGTLRDEWSANREWLGVNECEDRVWSPAPRRGGWNKQCWVLRRGQDTCLLYRTGPEHWLAWGVNRAGFPSQPHTLVAASEVRARRQARERFIQT